MDAYQGYYAGFRDLDDSIILGRAAFGWLEYKSVPIAPGTIAQQWHHLKLLVYNCDIVAQSISPSGQSNTLAVRDPHCLPSGRFGLKSYATGALWRNVQIRPVEHSDLIALIGNTTPPLAEADTLPNGAGSDQSARYIEPIYREIGNHHFDLNASPISSLRLLSPEDPTSATIQGAVTLTSPMLFVQDSSGGVAILQKQTSRPLEIGDEIEAKGEVVLHDFSSSLRDAEVHVLWSHTPVPPIVVTSAQAASGAYDALFIEIEGRVLKAEKGPGSTLLLTLNNQSQSFRAIVSDSESVSRLVEERSMLRLRGICVTDPSFTGNLTSFALLLPSIDDIQVVAGPPWWSAGHIAAGVIVLLLLALAAQTLHGHIERLRLRAILEERGRLAHEMHDTLAQSFAGIGFQLQAMRDEVGSESELRQQLDLACDLVKTSHNEARSSIAALRSDHLESAGLLKALDECAKRMVNGGSITISTSSSGDARRIPLRVLDTLFKIGQEAIANAVRHAQAGAISISTRYEQRALLLRIEDNGRGFVVGADSAAFGIRGMGKRADKIAAVLQIQSSPHHGTTVQVAAPLQPFRPYQNWVRFVSQRLWEPQLDRKGSGRTASGKTGYPAADRR